MDQPNYYTLQNTGKNATESNELRENIGKSHRAMGGSYNDLCRGLFRKSFPQTTSFS